MNLASLNVAAVHAATTFLAQPEGADSGGRGEGFGKSTPVGLLLMIVLLIVVGLLVRSMTKHLKRLPNSFDPETETEQGEDGSEDTAKEPDGAHDTPSDHDTSSDEEVSAREKSEPG